jgi:hypothetical protein
VIRKHVLAFAAVGALNLGAAVWAQDNSTPPPPAPATHAELIAARPPVTDSDITDRPYRIVGEVRADVRKATIFSRAPSRAHVFRELWERAERLGADAVVNARSGGSRVTALSWGSRLVRPGGEVPDRRGDRAGPDGRAAADFGAAGQRLSRAKRGQVRTCLRKILPGFSHRTYALRLLRTSGPASVGSVRPRAK